MLNARNIFSALRYTDFRGVLHLALDETQQVLLIHACGMVNVGIDLSDVIKITESI